MEKQADYQVVKTPRQRCAKVPIPHAELDLLPAFRTVVQDDHSVRGTAVNLRSYCKGMQWKGRAKRGGTQTGWTSTDRSHTKALEV